MDIEKLEKWHFELTEQACNALLELVLEGKKKATSGSVAGFHHSGETIPKEGMLSVITDWAGTPRCVVRTTRVQILPYKDIDFELARREGEDDSLESWRKNHEAYFRAEGKELGYTFSEELEVVFEEFEVVEILEEKGT